MPLVRRILKLDECVLKTSGNAGTFEGYASKFGGVDSHGDTILQGAFDSTLRTHGKPKMFFNHEWNMPIGKYTALKDDGNGLYVHGELTPGHTLGNDVRAALVHGTLDGMSIGGFVKSGDAEDKADGGQIIKKFSRLVEISPVAFPSDGGARIDLGTVKGEDIAEAISEIETVREFERFLRDASGFSKGAAAALVARCKVLFVPGEPVSKMAAADMVALAARLNRIAETT